MTNETAKQIFDTHFDFELDFNLYAPTDLDEALCVDEIYAMVASRFAKELLAIACLKGLSVCDEEELLQDLESSINYEATELLRNLVGGDDDTFVGDVSLRIFNNK